MLRVLGGLCPPPPSPSHLPALAGAAPELLAANFQPSGIPKGLKYNDNKNYKRAGCRRFSAAHRPGKPRVDSGRAAPGRAEGRGAGPAGRRRRRGGSGIGPRGSAERARRRGSRGFAGTTAPPSGRRGHRSIPGHRAGVSSPGQQSVVPRGYPSAGDIPGGTLLGTPFLRAPPPGATHPGDVPPRMATDTGGFRAPAARPTGFPHLAPLLAPPGRSGRSRWGRGGWGHLWCRSRVVFLGKKIDSDGLNCATRVGKPAEGS